MKNVLFTAAITLLLLVSFSACTVHIPYDMDWDHPEYRVILVIEPEDAHVLLNGKWIGDAYEFSTYESALVLRSRNNEIIIKKEGFVEEVIDLYDFSSRKITVRIKMMKDKEYREERRPARRKRPRRERPQKDGDVKWPEPPKKQKVDKETDKPEYKAKTAPPRDIPDEVKTGKQEQPVTVVQVILDIQPAEASIYLDGKFWGIAPPSGKIESLRLKSGKYSLEVVKPGFLPYTKKLNIKDKKVKLIIKLQKK